MESTSSETIDKYKKRYGEEYQKEIDEACEKDGGKIESTIF